MSAVNSIVAEQRRATRLADELANSTLLKSIPSGVRSGAVVLGAIADAGKRRKHSHDARVLEYLERCIGSIDQKRKGALLSWIEQLATDDDSIDLALDDLRDLSAPHKRAFSEAAMDMSKGASRAGQERQEWLLAEARKAIAR